MSPKKMSSLQTRPSPTSGFSIAVRQAYSQSRPSVLCTNILLNALLFYCVLPMLSVYDDAHRAPIEYSDSSDDCSSDIPPVPLTPGPLDPEQCTVAGRGFSGGAAGAPLALTVFAKDTRGVRIPEGGARVLVLLERTDTAEEVVKVEAIDNKDGTYTATYVAPPRGDYRLRIAMDGIPIGGSPFPVFFSPPTMAEIAASLLASARMGTTPDAALKMLPDGADALGENIEKCLCVSNVSQNIKPDQIKQLFQYCGKVVNVTFITEGKDTALVEFESSLEAGCAIGLNGVMVGDRSLNVKLAKAVFQGVETPSAETIATAHYDALSSTTQNAHHLVMQLASLRAVARTALLPAIQAEERKYEGRQEALNAAADISRKLGYKQPGQIYVPEPLTVDPMLELQKPVIDKHKLGGPRHYNGRGRFVRARVRSRSRSPLKKRDRRRRRSGSRQHRSDSREHRHSRHHRSRSVDRSSHRHHKERRSNHDEKKRDRHRHSKHKAGTDDKMEK